MRLAPEAWHGRRAGAPAPKAELSARPGAEQRCTRPAGSRGRIVTTPPPTSVSFQAAPKRELCEGLTYPFYSSTKGPAAATHNRDALLVQQFRGAAACAAGRCRGKRSEVSLQAVRIGNDEARARLKLAREPAVSFPPADRSSSARRLHGGRGPVQPPGPLLSHVKPRIRGVHGGRQGRGAGLARLWCQLPRRR